MTRLRVGVLVCAAEVGSAPRPRPADIASGRGEWLDPDDMRLVADVLPGQGMAADPPDVPHPRGLVDLPRHQDASGLPGGQVVRADKEAVVVHEVVEPKVSGRLWTITAKRPTGVSRSRDQQATVESLLPPGPPVFSRSDVIPTFLTHMSADARPRYLRSSPCDVQPAAGDTRRKHTNERRLVAVLPGCQPERHRRDGVG